MGRPAARVEAAFANALSERRLIEEDLFDRDYKPIPNTNPQKFSTRFDAFTDEAHPPIQEVAMATIKDTHFACSIDDTGYLPTTNDVYHQPLTGDYEMDLVNNRGTRIYKELMPSTAERGKSMHLRTYKRNTGEVVHALSVPVFVAQERWSSFLVGYRPAVRPDGVGREV